MAFGDNIIKCKLLLLVLRLAFETYTLTLQTSLLHKACKIKSDFPKMLLNEISKSLLMRVYFILFVVRE